MSSSNFNIKDVKELENKNVLNENDNQHKLANEYMKNIKGDENNYKKLKELYDKEYVDINDNLYPTFNDPNFNIKISNKKEFLNTRYPDINSQDVEEYKEKVKELSEAKFELAPHQLFVKNFLSFETPYNSLLLYHGLGSGKTCSAIGVSEDMRVYLQQMNIQQKILIVASPNVQENFKLQLFDERKLKKNNGVWDLEGCTSNKLLKEINPVSIRGLTKEKIISTIKNLINNYYTFMGYTKFSLMIDKIESSLPKSTKKAFKKKIQNEFNNRLIIIDEIHNIRTSSTIDNKKIVKSLFKLVQNASNMKLLILSATPMYNDYKEIIWLLNLMNLNDNKSEILLKDVFDENGDFITKDGVEIGKNKFIEKTRGYVSFIRGENPYTFPHRIFPSQFSKKKTFMGDLKYPIQQINGKDISSEPMEIIDTYQVEIGEYQDIGYNYIANKINSRDNNLVGNDNLGYNILQGPIQALNIVYPCELLDNIQNNKNLDKLDEASSSFIGKGGLHSIVTYDLNEESLIKNNYKYRDNVIEKYGRIFKGDNIKKYSPKIYEICNHIINSTGIVLVYSQYIDGGLIPIALALEELGFDRYGNNKSLLSKEEKNRENIVPIDPITNKKITSFTKDSNKSSYIMITGDSYHSHSNSEEVKAVTNENNKNGEKIKVILLSKAGSEGIDFKNVRSVHIMDPWYNMNRQEQIIGRGVRNFSHSNLELQHRNTSIFLYGTLLKNKEIESIDNYIYRIAEKKAIQMGKITRLLKENSVDCLLNIKQKNYILENMNNIHIEQILSNNTKIIHEIGDKPYSSTCDYMNNCDYKCLISKDDNIEYINKNVVKENKTTYNENYIIQNISPIIDKIKILFSSKYFYHKRDIIKELTIHKNYTMEEINYALDNLTFNKSEIIKDKYGYNGYIVNVGKYYYYQPYELNDEKISIFQRTVPLDIKNDKIKLTLDVEKEDDLVIPTLSEEVDIKRKGLNIIEKITSEYDNKNAIIFDLFDKLNYKDDDILVVFCQFSFDYLSFEEKGDISNYIYNKNMENSLENSLETNIYNYIHNNFYLKKNEGEYLLFENKGVLGFYMKTTNENNDIIWAEEGNYLNEYLENKIKEKYIFEKEYIVNNFSKYIGYVINIFDKKNDYNTLKFKLKFMQTTKGSGVICETHQKQHKLEIINDFLLNDYKIKNNKELLTDSDIKGKPKQICMFIEFIFRHFENIKKTGEYTLNNKIYKTNKWFLNPVQTVINKKFKQLNL